MSDSQHELKHKLTHWLQQRHPEKTALTITEFRMPDAGASNETLLFDMQWQENGEHQSESLVARLQPKQAGVFPDYDLSLQYRAMECLSDSDVPTPILAGFESDVAVLGTPFYLMKCITGKTITENPPYHMDGWFKALPERQRGEIWRNGIKAIAQVNRVDWQKLGFDYLDDPSKGDTALAQQLSYYRDFLQYVEKRGREYPKLRASLRWLENNQPPHDAVALCWGDAKVANLLIDGSDVVGVLDWEMVHLGNPVDDLAWWFTLDNALSDGICTPKLDGLPSREEIVALWEQESGHCAAQLDYYEMFGALKFGIIMASIGTKLMDEGIFPRESEFDLANPCTPVLDRLMERNGITV